MAEENKKLETKSQSKQEKREEDPDKKLAPKDPPRGENVNKKGQPHPEG